MIAPSEARMKPAVRRYSSYGNADATRGTYEE